MGQFADLVHKYMSGSSVSLNQTLNLIFDTVVGCKENAILEAKVCGAIMIATNRYEKEATTFYQAMLLRIQAEHNRREETRAQSIEAWLSIFAFVCELFLTIRIQRRPIPVMEKPFCQHYFGC